MSGQKALLGYLRNSREMNIINSWIFLSLSISDLFHFNLRRKNEHFPEDHMWPIYPRPALNSGDPGESSSYGKNWGHPELDSGFSRLPGSIKIALEWPEGIVFLWVCYS